LSLVQKMLLIYASRILKDADLSKHRDICIREAVKMIPKDLTNKFAMDIGCGEGRWSRLLAQRGANVLGIDNSRAMIKIAVERSKGIPQISFKYLGIEGLLNLEKKFDFVIASYIFNNIINLSKAFQVCNQILVNGGELVIITKTFRLPRGYLKKLRGFLLPVKIRNNFIMHTSVFTFKDYEKISRKYKFILVDRFSRVSPYRFSNEDLNKTDIIIEDQVMKYQKRVSKK